MRVRAEAEIRFQLPVLQVVQRTQNPAARNSRFRSAGCPGASSSLRRHFVKFRHDFIGGDFRRAVALAVQQHFAAQPAVFVHFEHVDGNVRRRPVSRSRPGIRARTQASGPEGRRSRSILMLARPCSRSRAISAATISAVCFAPGARQLARDEGLHAQAHSIESRARPGGRALRRDGAGRRFDGRLAPRPARNRRQNPSRSRGFDAAGCAAAQVNGLGRPGQSCAAISIAQRRHVFALQSAAGKHRKRNCSTCTSARKTDRKCRRPAI